ncbi:MAG: hypothetical protein ACOYN3_06880 [Acidimicrobiia bacterium]
MKWLGLWTAVAGAMVLAGCRADITTTTRMNANGSGAVSVELALDASAVEIAQADHGALEQRIVTSDLEAAGWQVGAWERRADGSAVLTLRKPFVRPADVADIYREISGSSGVFADVRAARESDVLSTHWKFRGTMNLAESNSGLTKDAALADKFRALGLDAEAVQRLLDSAVTENVSLRNQVALPHAAPVIWSGTREARTEMRSATRAIEWTRIWGIGGGIALVVLGAGVLVIGEARRRRRPSHVRPSTRNQNQTPHMTNR